MAYPVDYFTGDGTTTTFQLSQTPASATAIQVFISGVKQVSSLSNPAYSINGSQLIFPTAPFGGDSIEVLYLGVANQVNVPGTQTITQSMLSLAVANSYLYQATANGSQNTFTLNAPPVSANSLIVTANGVVQYDYTVNNTTLLLNFTPPNGTRIRAQALALAQNGVPNDGSVTNAKLSPNLTLTGNTTISGNLVVTGTTILTGNTTIENVNITNTTIVTSEMVMAPVVNTQIINAGTSNTLTIVANNFSAVTIANTGFFGINTTSPVAPLHLNGGSYSQTSQPVLRLDDTATTTYNGSSYVGGQIRFNFGNATGSYAGINFSNFGASSQDFFGVVQNSSGYDDFVWQGYNGTSASYAENMRLNNAGNLGLGVTPSAWGSYKAIQFANGVSLASYIGSSNPIAALNSGVYFNGSNNIYALSSNPVGAYYINQGVHSWQIGPPGTATANATLTQAMTLDNSGNLYVGTTTQYDGGVINALNNTNNSVVGFRNSYASGGNPCVGYFRLTGQVGSTSNYILVGNTLTTGDTVYIYGNGNIVNKNNSYGTLSDAKLKTNVVLADTQWNDVKALGQVMKKFNFLTDPANSPLQLGWVAQDVQTISPGLVFSSPDRDDEGKTLETTSLGVNTSVAMLKAFKALSEALLRIEQLETQVTALQNKIGA